MDYINMLAFGVYPYIALAVFFIGTWIRYDREQYTWKTSSSQILESKQLRKGSLPFHIGIIGIFFGHLVGLLTPKPIWHMLGVTNEMKQWVAIIMGGIFGLICLYGLAILVNRRMNNTRVRANSSTMDILLLWILLAQLVLGLVSIFYSISHVTYGAEGEKAAVMVALMTWAQNIVTLDPVDAVAAIANTPVDWVFKLHVVLGMTIFLIFPFSRLVHMFSVPVQYVARQHQVVRKKFAR
ncbi:respiratory nitrate reductase subunit gamma [Idiomarina sp. OT37-5b]|jgi:nitrate reductase gamma subunit|uniref:nitrate reductase (quinone) n=1 Tax=Idiomarina aquatica TaxID=1327752 RepID=A0AA94EHT7_9GAMM|nr:MULTISPECIES: respiratory nitrate reductase subunit gamma [Idiomarina]AVJ54920.1 respiratory nitrate reductase subunit gamma [Idiomarina sp. OT37-5b]RUO45549.1 respiratory nitrate reductase subunit gamma [Idiomarina aquatica]